jgi:mannose-6-phosphate isomerase-like protein (cupin superfamily)
MKLIKIDENRTWEPGKHTGCMCRDVASDAHGVTKLEIHRTTMKPGGTADSHCHAESEEIFVIITGEATFIDENGKEFVVGPGDALFVPQGGMHAVENRTHHDVQWYAVRVPNKA